MPPSGAAPGLLSRVPGAAPAAVPTVGGMELPPLSRLYAPRTLARAAASGASELIPYHRAPGPVKAALIALPGIGYAGAVAWLMSRQGAEARRSTAATVIVPGAAGGERRITPQLVGVTTAVGLFLSGCTAASIAIDGAAERFLIRRGVRRPRLVMGAAGFLLGWVFEYLDADGTGDERRAERPAADDGAPWSGTPEDAAPAS